MSDAQSRGGSPVAPLDHVIQLRAEECQRILDEAILESASGPVFLEQLKGTGATPDEVHDYIKQFSQ